MEDSHPSSKSEDGIDEDILRQKEFSKPKHLDVSKFMVIQDDDVDEKPSHQVEHSEGKDEAIGEASELFVDSSKSQGSTTMNVEAEETLSKGLIIVMIGIWTALGAMVGTQLSPIPSAISLSSMAIFGFWLSNRWIPQKSMRYLGVAWAIISMKLLYGLSIDAWSWGWFASSPLGEGQTLGIALLTCVGLNIVLAFYHDEDAIATQATLVFFAIGSAAGGLFGGTGVAIVLFIAMVCMHSLAFVRSSGNLASLGIAVSFLWIGLHALSKDWTFLTLDIVQISNRSTLFLLMCGATGVNAFVATRFVKEQNWLSNFVEAIGLGKPSLWAVSVGLGMCGALMTIAAHRTETGFALAQLFLLAFAFSTSYLVVRGVAWTRVAPISMIALPILAFIFVLMDLGILSFELPLELQPYGMFAIFAAFLTIIMLLQNQRKVSDHVLWIGAIACSILLTLLIPSETTSDAQILIISQAALFLSLASLGFLRRSASIAGASILAPQIWLIGYATDLKSRLFGQDVVLSTIASEELSIWLGLLLFQSVILCVPMGRSQLNIFKQLDNLSEFGARLSQSGILQLWNLSCIGFLLVIWAFTSEDGIPYIFASFLLWFSLCSFHLSLSLHQKQTTNPTNLMIVAGFLSAVLSWNFGSGEFWFFGWTLLHVYAYIRYKSFDEIFKETEERGFAKMMNAYLGISAILLFTMILDNQTRIELVPGLKQSLQFNLSFMNAISMGLTTALFWLTIPKMRNMLLSSCLIIALFIAYLQYSLETTFVYDEAIALLLFIATGAYATISGETRRGLSIIGKREERIQRLMDKQQLMLDIVKDEDATSVNILHRIDAEQVRLFEERKRRKKRSGEGQNDEIFTADIHYQPIVVLSFLVIFNLGTAWISYSTAYAIEALLFATCINMILFGLARYQASRFQLRMPDIIGIESTAFVAMGALVITHLAGRMTTGVLVSDDFIHLSVLFIGLATLGAMTLYQRRDLGMRIPNVVEGIVFFFFLDRIIALIFGGEVPLFTQVNPLTNELLNATVPLMVVEFGLVALVGVSVWIDHERERRKLAAHRSALERSGMLLMLALLSWGLAAFAFTAHMVRRSLVKQDEKLLLGCSIALCIAYASTRYWLVEFLPLLPSGGVAMFSLGIFLLFSVGYIIVSRNSSWLTSTLSSAHILLYVAPILMLSGSLFILGILSLSAVTWLSGIIENRKTVRIMGALNLLVAWIGLAIEAIYGGSTDLIFLGLVASALVLFTVTALSQSRMKTMMAEN